MDLAVLAALELQLEDSGPARAFARDYVAAFPARYLRLRESVDHRDLSAAMDATLSLRSTSIMVGAVTLAALAAEIATAVLTTDLRAARRALPPLERCGLATIDELQARYLAR